MTKAEADAKCMKLFGMNSEDYARKIFKAYQKEKNEQEEIPTEKVS